MQFPVAAGMRAKTRCLRVNRQSCGGNDVLTQKPSKVQEDGFSFEIMVVGYFLCAVSRLQITLKAKTASAPTLPRLSTGVDARADLIVCQLSFLAADSHGP